jgi:hypothetical protein
VRYLQTIRHRLLGLPSTPRLRALLRNHLVPRCRVPLLFPASQHLHSRHRRLALRAARRLCRLHPWSQVYRSLCHQELRKSHLQAHLPLNSHSQALPVKSTHRLTPEAKNLSRPLYRQHISASAPSHHRRARSRPVALDLVPQVPLARYARIHTETLTMSRLAQSNTLVECQNARLTYQRRCLYAFV